MLVSADRSLLNTLLDFPIGFYDDWIKLTKKGAKGLGIRDKLLLQAIVGGTVGLILCFWGKDSNATTLVVPFLGSAWAFQLGYLYMAWSALVVTGSSNAVNLTDGLDGLATLCAISVALAFGLMAYFAGHAGMAEHLGVVWVPGGQEITVVCAALAGSCETPSAGAWVQPTGSVTRSPAVASAVVP